MNFVKKIFVEILVMFVASKIKRSQCRYFLRKFSFIGFKQFLKFKNHKILTKTALLIEPNECHGEILPGYAKYFIDCGYQIDRH